MYIQPGPTFLVQISANIEITGISSELLKQIGIVLITILSICLLTTCILVAIKCRKEYLASRQRILTEARAAYNQ